MLNYLVEMVRDDQTSPNEQIIDPCLNGKRGQLVQFRLVHIVRIDQNGKRPLTFSFFSQQGFVNKLIHSLLPLVVMQKCEKFSALRG